MEVCSQNLNDPKTILLKVNGNKCNMACEYCSELPKAFTKEQCQFDLGKMSEILKKVPKDADIIFHGGEPTLIGLDNMQKLIERIHDLGFKLKPSVQTNGLLGEEWVDFFAENRETIRVSVSIDGDKSCNSYRRTKKGNADEAFRKVDFFLTKLDERGIPFRCIATINRQSFAKGKDIVAYFAKYNHLKFVRLNPCFDLDTDGIRDWAITPKQYLKCLKDAFVQMLKLQTYRKFKLDPLMDVMNNSQRNNWEFEFKCNKFASLFPNGLITSCDAMREVRQNMPKLEDIFTGFVQPDYVAREVEFCNNCKELSICKGGCPPLMHRYRMLNVEYLKEYCYYRVELRKYIIQSLEMV